MEFPAFKKTLLGPDPLRDRLCRSFEDAMQFFASTTPVELLGALLSDRAARALLEGSEIDHIGLLLPAHSASEVADAAKYAGFGEDQVDFPSIAFTRELSQRAGREVKTQIFKGWGTTAGRSVAIETFLPDTDEALIRTWIDSGVGTHVALRLPDQTTFLEACRALPRAGLGIPAFMSQPTFIPSEDMTILYFDLGLDRDPQRMEIRATGDVR